MATIILTGWREGLQKIALAKLQQQLLRLSLKAAKENVDGLLDGHSVSLEVADHLAEELLNRATELGAQARLSSAESAKRPAGNVVPIPQPAA